MKHLHQLQQLTALAPPNTATTSHLHRRHVVLISVQSLNKKDTFFVLLKQRHTIGWNYWERPHDSAAVKHVEKKGGSDLTVGGRWVRPSVKSQSEWLKLQEREGQAGWDDRITNVWILNLFEYADTWWTERLNLKTSSVWVFRHTSITRGRHWIYFSVCRKADCTSFTEKCWIFWSGLLQTCTFVIVKEDFLVI